MADSSTSNEVQALSWLQNIVADTQSSLVTTSMAQSQLTANNEAQTNLSNTAANLLEMKAQNDEVIAAAEQAAKLRVQARTQEAAVRFGIDPERGADFLLDQVDALRQGMVKTQEGILKVRQKEDSSLFDDPVQWVKDLVTLPAARREVQRSVADTQMAANNIQATNAALKHVADNSATIDATITTASADAATSNAAVAAQVEAIKARSQAIKFNSDNALAAMEMDKARLNLQYNLVNANQQAKYFDLQLKKWDQDQKEWSWKVAQKEAEVSAKLEGKSVDDYMLETINIGRAATGLEPISGTAILATKKVLASGGTEELNRYWQIGERTRNTGIPSIGISPSDAADNVKNLPFNPPPGPMKVLDIIRQAEDAANKNKTLDPRDKNARAAFINDFTIQAVKQQYLANKNDPTNMFNVGELKNYFEIASVASLPIVQKVLKDAAAAGITLDDPKKVTALGVAAVKRGTITSQEFQGLADVYQRANLINLQSLNLKGYGLPVPENGMSYRVKLSTFGDTVDMTNSTDLGRYMMNELSGAITSGRLTGRSGVPLTGSKGWGIDPGSIREVPMK